ncbi:hypothetical protein BH20ACI1_BH20ACI1_27710 [soil metagenome]
MLNQFIGQNLADKYQIDEVLRDSGLGKIYRATHLLMDKHVTVKILPPALAIDESIVKQFSAEARTVSHISHPNILNVTDFGSDRNGAVYIVMEDADGETLEQIIERDGKFPVDRAVKITYQIAAALSAAHINGVIHHHLNSRNVLLTHTAHEPDIVKVLDFGSDSVYENGSFDEETDMRDLKYLSPEQNSSVSEADERSDVYSLGVILYEMLAGEVPYRAENPTDLMMKQAENPPAPLSAYREDLPAYIEPILIKALAKNPDMRYQTADEFARDLSRVSKNISPNGIPIATEEAENTTNNLWKTAFVVLIGIVGLSAGMIYFTQTKQTNPQTQLPTDANAQPVQPLNPATGMNEQGSAGFVPYSADGMMPNSNMSLPQQIPNGDGFGDGYNPWATGRPPAGAPPQFIAPGGQIYTIPGDGSQFMPQDGGYILVPQPLNANTNANANVKPSPTPKATPSQANTQTQPSPTPAEKPATTETKPTPAPKTEKPPAKPTEKPPASLAKPTQSGKEQDSL